MAVSKWPSLASTHSTFNLIGPCKRHPNTESHKNTYARATDICSGGSRGAPPPLFLDQIKARRAWKNCLGNRAPPYLRVWMIWLFQNSSIQRWGWGAHKSLVWIPEVIVSRIEGKAMWLSVFYYSYRDFPRHHRSFIHFAILSSVLLSDPRLGKPFYTTTPFWGKFWDFECYVMFSQHLTTQKGFYISSQKYVWADNLTSTCALIITNVALASQLPYSYVTNQSQHCQCVVTSWRREQGTRCNYGLLALKENFTGVLILSHCIKICSNTP